MASLDDDDDDDDPTQKKKKKLKKLKKTKTKEVEALRAEVEKRRAENAVLELRAELAKAKAENAALAEQNTDTKQVYRCYVGGLPWSATEDAIRDYFDGHTENGVRDVTLKLTDEWSFTGIAFVTLSSEAALTSALALDGSAFDQSGLLLKVRRDRDSVSRRPAPQRQGDSLTVYAGNMPFATSRHDVVAFFEERHAKVTNVRYHTHEETGHFRGFCHLEFADEASLQRAIDANGLPFRGRTLRVSHSVTGRSGAGPPPPPFSGGAGSDATEQKQKQKRRRHS
mmetsp:Transcript_9198/g.28216  ORF Transcript_9198/g.28216 Transcript_9198/m.28216 type:complete len:283 (-) Transcript_9198:338-1186(-)